MKNVNDKAIGIVSAAIMVSALLLLIPCVSGETIELTYDFAEPITGKTVIDGQMYDTVSIQGCDLYGAPGEPVLPLKTAMILIPYGEEVQDIQVIPGEEVYLGEFYIVPGQKQVPLSFEGPVEPTLSNEEVYNSQNIHPEEVYSEVSVQGMRGYQILILNLYPVQYIPKARQVSYFESMNVVVNTRASTPDELFRGLPQDRTRVAKIIDNPAALSTYDSAEVSKPEQSPLDPTQPYQYVIITNEELLGTGGPHNFQALRDSKIAKGMTATIVTTEWIYANYGTTMVPQSQPEVMSGETVVEASVESHEHTVEIKPSTSITYPILDIPHEISYDDGTDENCYAWYDAGNRYAVRFTPPSYPVDLDTARIRVYSGWQPGHEAFDVEVYDDDGAGGSPGTLLGTVRTTATAYGWHDVDISGLGITITSGDFYIAFNQLTGYPNCEGLCIDTDEPHYGRSWDYYGGVWSLERPDDNYMIRCVVDLPGPELCGDVAPYPDCDGKVDMGDVILLLNNVSYPENRRYVLCNGWAGNCRCSGKIDMGDVILLLNNVSYPEDPRYVLDCC